VNLQGTRMQNGWTALPRGRAVNATMVAALVALPFGAMLAQLDRPLDGDEGVYAVMARLMLDGGTPYRDFIDNKPPLEYAWFSAGLALFGDNIEAFRLVPAVVMSATALCVYLTGRLLFPPAGAFVALAVFAGSQLIVPDMNNGLPETLMVLPEVAGFLTLLYGLRSGKQAWFLVAGLLFGLAVMTKPVAIWPAIAFVPGLLVLRQRAVTDDDGSRSSQLLRSLVSIGLYGAGGLIALVAVITPTLLQAERVHSCQSTKSPQHRRTRFDRSPGAHDDGAAQYSVH